MATVVSRKVIEEQLAFVARATKCFSEQPETNTYTDMGHVNSGELFAVRWGMGSDCVLVFKVDENYQPIIYSQEIKKG